MRAGFRQLAKNLGFVPVIGRAKVAERARENSENLEQAARRARYEFLERTAKRRHAEFIFSAHTMDDQAETVLLRLMRGSAGAGLGGMEATRPYNKGSPFFWFVHYSGRGGAKPRIIAASERRNICTTK